MSDGKKYPIARIRPIAEEIVETLSPYCDPIVIAGSLRRERPSIGDIEIVCLPKYDEEADLFGNVVNQVSLVDRFFNDRTCPYKGLELNGPQMKKFRFKNLINVDLFLPKSPDHWGAILFVRTGSSQFNLWVMGVVQRRARTYFEKGRLHRDGQLLATPTEEDVFRELGLPYIPPNMRDDYKWLEIEGVK